MLQLILIPEQQLCLTCFYIELKIGMDQPTVDKSVLPILSQNIEIEFNIAIGKLGHNFRGHICQMYYYLQYTQGVF